MREECKNLKVAYFDCFSGISGDMILASFLDAGLKLSDLLTELKKLKISGFSLEAKKILKQGISATRLELSSTIEKRFSYLEFLEILKSSNLSRKIKEKSIETFSDLACAEKKIHGVKSKDFRFEQLGQIDTLIDIVGTHLAVGLLQIKEIYFSKIKIARGGTFKHGGGDFPLPAPAALELLKGFSLEITEELSEYVTPTGAALVKNLAKKDGPGPNFKLLKIGYGAGSFNFGKLPNLVRLLLGER